MVLPWPAPLSRPPTLQRFWKQGDSLHPRRGLRPLHPAWGTEGFVLACQRARGRGWAGFPRLQPHSLIVCDSLIVCAPAFSSPVGVEPLQSYKGVTRRYKLLQGRYRAVTSRYESLHSRYGAVTDLTSRYGVGRLLKSLCLTTAFSPVPAFLGGSCPLGCSLKRPCHRGLSMVSPQCSHVCGRLREREAGLGPTSWGVL